MKASVDLYVTGDTGLSMGYKKLKCVSISTSQNQFQNQFQFKKINNMTKLIIAIVLTLSSTLQTHN
jgi:hypothetical protein